MRNWSPSRRRISTGDGTSPDIFLTGYIFGYAETDSCAYPSNEQACIDADGYWDGELCFYSPIVIDTEKDGFSLTAAQDGVMFDANADGIAERIAWTNGQGDDAWLAMDRNGNGMIDNGSELFGNFTPGVSLVAAPNGFEALKALDDIMTDSGAGDGVIDEHDDAFPQLLLWRDANHNGVSDTGELRRCVDAGILAIYTNYKTSSRRDRYGNQFRQRARVVSTDKDSWAYDVWLVRQ